MGNHNEFKPSAYNKWEALIWFDQDTSLNERVIIASMVAYLQKDGTRGDFDITDYAEDIPSLGIGQLTKTLHKIFEDGLSFLQTLESLETHGYIKRLSDKPNWVEVTPKFIDFCEAKLK